MCPHGGLDWRFHGNELPQQYIVQIALCFLVDFGVATEQHRRHDRPGDTFRGWLWTVTRNKIRDFHRGRAGDPSAVATDLLIAHFAVAIFGDAFLPANVTAKVVVLGLE
jgi:hypothetical protein